MQQYAAYNNDPQANNTWDATKDSIGNKSSAETTNLLTSSGDDDVIQGSENNLSNVAAPLNSMMGVFLPPVPTDGNTAPQPLGTKAPPDMTSLTRPPATMTRLDRPFSKSSTPAAARPTTVSVRAAEHRSSGQCRPLLPGYHGRPGMGQQHRRLHRHHHQRVPGRPGSIIPRRTRQISRGILIPRLSFLHPPRPTIP